MNDKEKKEPKKEYPPPFETATVESGDKTKNKNRLNL